MSTVEASANPQSEVSGLLSSGEQRALARQLSLSIAAAGALGLCLALSMMGPQRKEVSQLVAGVAALLVGIPALQAAWRSLRRPDLHGIADQLIALAFLAAWAAGDLITATLLPLIMMVSHILEERSLLGSKEAIRALTRLTENTARRVAASGEIEEISVSALHAGDIIEVRAGDRVPADGLVVSGNSSVDTASITGESVPIDVAAGSPIHGGSINMDGLLTVQISHVGNTTTLGRVIALMQDAEHIKPAITKLLESHARGYIALVLLVTASYWFLTGNTDGALTLLVASCPLALVLAAPATSIAAISVASRHGVLVKGAAFLEQLATVDAVVFDKTGTLTSGELRLVDVVCEDGVEPRTLLRLAASLGAASSHPVSRAVGGAVAVEQYMSLVDVKETRGLGVAGMLDGQVAALGRAALFERLQISAPAAPGSHHGPVAGVSLRDRFLGWILLGDQIRPEAADALQDLRKLGLSQQVMITGDRRAEAERVASALQISEVRPEALPQDKMRFVVEETRRGFRTMVVGDGINDALALKAGAVGVAMGAQGADVALASADLVLMTNDLRRLGTCVRLSRRSRATILINVAIGLGWTAVMIAIAAFDILGRNGAVVVALLQNAGTLAVIANSGRLLKFQEELP